MGVFTFSDEFTSPVPAARLFKVMVVDARTLLPKILPQYIKSIEYVQGDGEPGSIMQTTFQDGFKIKQLKSKIEAVDAKNFSSTTSLVQDEESQDDKIEKVVNEVQFVPSPDGGSINKIKSTYHTKGDIVLTEEDVKEGKEWFLSTYKAVEAYLLQNPDA